MRKKNADPSGYRLCRDLARRTGRPARTIFVEGLKKIAEIRKGYSTDLWLDREQGHIPFGWSDSGHARREREAFAAEESERRAKEERDARIPWCAPDL